MRTRYHGGKVQPQEPVDSASTISRLHYAKKPPTPRAPSGPYISPRARDDMLGRLTRQSRRMLVEEAQPHDGALATGSLASTVFIGPLTDRKLPTYSAERDDHLTLYWARQQFLASGGNPQAGMAEKRQAFLPALGKPQKRQMAQKKKPQKVAPAKGKDRAKMPATDDGKTEEEKKARDERRAKEDAAAKDDDSDHEPMSGSTSPQRESPSSSTNKNPERRTSSPMMRSPTPESPKDDKKADDADGDDYGDDDFEEASPAKDKTEEDAKEASVEKEPEPKEEPKEDAAAKDKAAEDAILNEPTSPSPTPSTKKKDRRAAKDEARRRQREAILDKLIGTKAAADGIGLGAVENQARWHFEDGWPPASNVRAMPAERESTSKFALTLDTRGDLIIQLTGATPALVLTCQANGAVVLADAISPTDNTSAVDDTASEATTTGGGASVAAHAAAAQRWGISELENGAFVIESAMRRGELVEMTLDADVWALRLVSERASSSFCEMCAFQ